MNTNSNSLSSIVKTAAAIALIIFLFEFRVHIGFALLSLSVVALVFGLILAYLGTFQPKVLAKYSEQAASSYQYLLQLFKKTVTKPEPVANLTSEPAITYLEQAITADAPLDSFAENCGVVENEASNSVSEAGTSQQVDSDV